jgi:hypothetical protein
MKFLKTRGATAVAILPPGTLRFGAQFADLSSAGLNANHNRVEIQFYSRC